MASVLVYVHLALEAVIRVGNNSLSGDTGLVGPPGFPGIHLSAAFKGGSTDGELGADLPGRKDYYLGVLSTLTTDAGCIDHWLPFSGRVSGWLLFAVLRAMVTKALHHTPAVTRDSFSWLQFAVTGCLR